MATLTLCGVHWCSGGSSRSSEAEGERKLRERGNDHQVVLISWARTWTRLRLRQREAGGRTLRRTTTSSSSCFSNLVPRRPVMLEPSTTQQLHALLEVNLLRHTMLGITTEPFVLDSS
uniref:Predicted protein n=1 Tax=Hordeum vulgare subsp. vulgare TaxID=112509 RepID=F2EK13_HORVV|nr:predicted protein [Hordeum vulgare subsp. vulgare]